MGTLKVEISGGPGLRQMSVGWVGEGVMLRVVGDEEVEEGRVMRPWVGVLSSW